MCTVIEKNDLILIILLDTAKTVYNIDQNENIEHQVTSLATIIIHYLYLCYLPTKLFTANSNRSNKSPPLMLPGFTVQVNFWGRCSRTPLGQAEVIFCMEIMFYSNITYYCVQILGEGACKGLLHTNKFINVNIYFLSFCITWELDYKWTRLKKLCHAISKLIAFHHSLYCHWSKRSKKRQPDIRMVLP